jgi:hypothetical protein
MSAGLISYLRALVAGYASIAVRLLRGRPCPCEFCRDHRAFIRESAAAYRAEVRGLAAAPAGGKAPATSEVGWPE